MTVKATRNALTIDVEDYYHVSAFETHVPRSRWGDYESRVLRNTHRILDLLDQHDVKATFFVLGWVAERQPQLVRMPDTSHFFHRKLIDLRGAIQHEVRRWLPGGQ